MTKHPAIQFLEALGKTSVFIRAWQGKSYPAIDQKYQRRDGSEGEVKAWNVQCDRSKDGLEAQRWTADQWPRMVAELKRQNSAEFKPGKTYPFRSGGWCPYLVVNSGGHKLDQITECHALFIEFDAPLTKEESMLKLQAFPLPYSILIESRAGYQVYWLLDKATTPRLWRQLQWRLIEYFESDAGIEDPNRCMRLPGFYHLKEGHDPFMIQMHECRDDRRYSLEDFDKHLPEVPEWRLKIDRASRSYAPIPEGTETFDIRNFKDVLKHYKERAKREWDTAQCPVHARGEGHSKDSLHINSLTGAYHCWNGCEAKEIYKEICLLSGWKPERKVREPQRPERQPQSQTEQPQLPTESTAVPSQDDKSKAPDFNETLDQVDLLEAAIDDDAELDWHLTNFAFESQLSKRGFTGSKLRRLARARKDGLAAVELIDAHQIIERQGIPQMLIGANLPRGVVVVIGASGGTGKTTLMYDFAKHIAMGQPWNGYSVQQGKVLVIQCDEPRLDINKKLRAAKFREVPPDSVHFITEWRFTQFRQLERLVEQQGYALVVIDSWTAVHAGMGIDLTSSSAGDNVYLLRNLANRLNCTFIVVHHLNKSGGFRDSSTIEDNCSEVWRIRRGIPEERLKPNERLLEITKSRSGLEGKYKLSQIPADYSWRHDGPWECPDSPEEPGLMLRIQDYFVCHPNERFGAKDIANHFEIDYGKADIELKRLENIGVVQGEWTIWRKPEGDEVGFFSYSLYGANLPPMEPQTNLSEWDEF